MDELTDDLIFCFDGYLDFHMLIEDSDSTVASNPSSTGADTMHVSLEYPGKDSREK